MVTEMGVVDGGVELTTTHFTDFPPGTAWTEDVYAGPDVSSVPMEVLGAINGVFQSLGLTT
jgi:hypothetical protein